MDGPLKIQRSRKSKEVSHEREKQGLYINVDYGRGMHGCCRDHHRHAL
jgi:hypothetical protein